MQVSMEKKGNNCIVVGTNCASVEVWFEDSHNSVIESDIKSELSAIAIAEIICEHLQVYVDIHSKGEPK